MVSITITGTIDVDVCLEELWHDGQSLRDYCADRIDFCSVEVEDVTEG